MERAIGPALRKLSNLCSRYFEYAANRRTVEAITGTNAWIIGYIGRMTAAGQAVYQRDVEAHFGVNRSTASRVVNLMVQKGLLIRQSVPEDKRLHRLLLTDRAQEVKRLMDDDHAAFEAALRRGFSEEELTTLFMFLDRMQDNLRRFDETEGRNKS